MQGMAEVCAIAPVDARLVGLEGDRLGFLRVHDEVDVVLWNREAVGQIFHFVQIGQDDGYLVTALDLELTQANGRRL